MKKVSAYIDLCFCLIVLPAMFITFPVERWVHYFPTYVICVGVWLYALYFLNRCITVPSLFKGRRGIIIGITAAVLSIAITYALASVSLYTPRPNQLDNGINRLFPVVLPYQQAVWSLFMIVETFSFAVGLLTQTTLQKSQRLAVEAERDKAQIALYKAQIKPHFLFNTLNSLYGLFLTHDGKALASLEKFIAMMRYMHTTSNVDFVTLREETDYIRQYVDMQTLRLNSCTKVSLHINIENPGLKIAPMLLITFVENCFKHGVSPVDESIIHISLKENGHRLTLETSNRIAVSDGIESRHRSNTGIANCRKRLALSYPSSHTLLTESCGDTYKVKLSIEL